MLALGLSAGCNNYMKDRLGISRSHKQDYRDRTNLALTLLAMQGPRYLGHSCFNRDPRFNPFYDTYPFNYVDRQDWNSYKTLIIGDSTMDFSHRIDGWIDRSKVQVIAVSGNTCCQMLMQRPIADATQVKDRWVNRQETIETVVISSMCGNDLLQHGKVDVAKENGWDLLTEVARVFPGRRIVWAGVHPTRVDYGNQTKGEVNNYLKTHPDLDCYVDPLPIFGKTEGQAADEDQMIPGDAVHYGVDMANGIRNAMEACGAEMR